MVIKSFFKVFWLALQPFDTLQKYIGWVGLTINILITFGVISGGGIWAFYNPQIIQNPSHDWFKVSLIAVSLLAVFVVIAAWKLQFQKDRLNHVRFAVCEKVLNGNAYLEVTNEAKPETFSATMRVHNSIHNQSELLPLYWEGYGENVQLGTGDTRHILVARQTNWPAGVSLPDRHGLDIYKATAVNQQGFGTFHSGIWGVFNDGNPNKADPVFLEVIIKPAFSSKKGYKAYYVLEQPLLNRLIFRKVEALL